MKRLLLDEHVPALYRVQLRRREPALTVWQIGDEGAPPKGTLDPDILVWCEANEFVLVTNNRKSIPVHLADHLAAGGHLPGILQLDLDAPIGLVLEDLWIAAVASRDEEFRDTIIYVPLKLSYLTHPTPRLTFNSSRLPAIRWPGRPYDPISNDGQHGQL